jgi:outer membrane protein OmpA-like peptidoglycan-associated protein
MDLSKKRAESVKKFFSQRGLDESKMQTDGRGEAEPVASNDTAKGRAENRRVEIVVSRPSSPSGTGMMNR